MRFNDFKYLKKKKIKHIFVGNVVNWRLYDDIRWLIEWLISCSVIMRFVRRRTQLSGT